MKDEPITGKSLQLFSHEVKFTIIKALSFYTALDLAIVCYLTMYICVNAIDV